MSSRMKLIEMLRRLRDACDALATYLEEQEAEEPKPITPQPPAPTAARTGISALLPKTGDDRPLGWLENQLREKQEKNRLSYEITEQPDGYLVRVWFAAGLPAGEKRRIRRWVMWAKRTLAAKRGEQ